MQRKKNIRLSISLVTLLLCIVLFFVFTNSKNNSLVDKGMFQLSNLETIDRFILESTKEKIELKFDGSTWQVDGRPADRQLITVFFATLKQTEAKREVATVLQDSLQKEIISHGIKISCFEGSHLAKEFWTIGNAQKTETYFQLKGGKPYLVTIPGYRVYVASIFELATIDWRDKLVFNFNWQNIKDLQVTFANDGKQNFRASYQNKFFGIEGIASTDTTKLNNFMDALLQLRAERILSKAQAKPHDTLLAHKPIMEISIHDIANRDYTLKIFSTEKGKDFLVGKTNEDVVLLNPFSLKEVFRKRDFFVK